MTTTQNANEKTAAQLEFDNDLQIVIDTALRFGSADPNKMSGQFYMALSQSHAKADAAFREKYSPK